MTEERSLDAALDEIERWSDSATQSLQALAVNYLRQAQPRLQADGRASLDLPLQAPLQGASRSANAEGHPVEREPVIASNPEILGGAHVFADTRVPVRT